MVDRFIIATVNGILVVEYDRGIWNGIGSHLPGNHVTSVVSTRDAVVAGTTRGIWRSGDRGSTWQAADGQSTNRHIRWLSWPAGQADRVLAGTEPAGILVSPDSARSWRSAPEVEILRDRLAWFLPYSANAGCVRGFAVSGSSPEPHRIYAAVEVGGVLCSDDGGRSWQLVAGSDGDPNMDRDLGRMVHPDVHSIAVRPSSHGWVMAATGGGIYRSTDGGRTWKNIYPCYIRALWIDPLNPQRLVAGPARGVAKNGRIEVSSDGGQTWQPAMQGLPTPWANHMVDRFARIEDFLFAVLSNGELWYTSTRITTWKRALPDVPGITAVTAG